MSSKRPSLDADNVHRQPPQKVVARRSSASVLSEPKVELRKIPSDSRVWGMKATTCLSIGLDPSDINHKPVVCNNCTSFWEIKLKYDISKYSKKPVSRRYLCERPFDCSDRAEKGKVHARDRMRRLFSGDGDLSAPSSGQASTCCVTPTGPQPRMQKSASSSTLKKVKVVHGLVVQAVLIL